MSKFTFWYWTANLSSFALGLFITNVAGCGPATGAEGARIEIVNAIDGTPCYILREHGEAKGVSCK